MLLFLFGRSTPGHQPFRLAGLYALVIQTLSCPTFFSNAYSAQASLFAPNLQTAARIWVPSRRTFAGIWVSPDAPAILRLWLATLRPVPADPGRNCRTNFACRSDKPCARARYLRANEGIECEVSWNGAATFSSSLIFR